MPIFRFCRIIEDRGRQYLLRAANTLALVHPDGVRGPATMLTIETWVSDDGDGWDNMRYAIDLPSEVAMLQALECCTAAHVREACRLLLAHRAKQVSTEELLEAHDALDASVRLAIVQRYGRIG